jgi:hypothetical protein
VKPEDAASQLAAVVERLINLPDCAWDRDAYGDGHAAQRVAAAIRDGMA